MSQKIIIWGHKTNGDTFSFIHSAYYKAFRALGYETYWFEDKDDISNFNFDNSIFLTENGAQSRIPLNKNSKYILHHVRDLSKYNDNNLDFINLANYLKWCDDGIDKIYNIGNSLAKISDCCYWDDKTKTIHQPWATNLVPSEINLDNAVLKGKEINKIYYVGTKQEDNRFGIDEFTKLLTSKGKTLELIRGSEEDNVKLIQESLISIDIRGKWHVECGYLPCRVFKNISYGRLTGTNSEHVKKIFGEYVIYEPDMTLLYDKVIEAEQNSTINDVRDAMNFVKINHTYINRVNNLLKVI